MGVACRLSVQNKFAAGTTMMLSLVAERLVGIWLLWKVEVQVVSSGSETIWL